MATQSKSRKYETKKHNIPVAAAELPDCPVHS